MVQKLNLPNIHLTKWSMAPIWGGSSLLFMQLRCMKDLLEFKTDKKWDWDYVLNLSEADFPIKYKTHQFDYLTTKNKFQFL